MSVPVSHGQVLGARTISANRPRLNDKTIAEPSVAVILPTYNRQTFLPTALASITQQTVTPSQLVIVDDASTDRTAEIAEDFAEKASFEVTVRTNQRNSGIGFSRQEGAENVRSGIDYVSYLSDDDVWQPHFLERMVSCVGPTRVAYCHYEVVDRLKGTTFQPFDFPRIETKDEFVRTALSWAMRPDMFVNFSSLLIPREVLARVHFRRDVRKGEDLLFLLDSLIQKVEYKALEDMLVRVVFHRSMGSLNWELEDRRKLVNGVVEALLRLGISEETVRYGMRDAFYWARFGGRWPALRIRRLISSAMQRLPFTRQIAKSTLTREKLARGRRIDASIRRELS